MRKTTVKKLNAGNVRESSIMKLISPKSYEFCGWSNALFPLDAGLHLH